MYKNRLEIENIIDSKIYKEYAIAINKAMNELTRIIKKGFWNEKREKEAWEEIENIRKGEVEYKKRKEELEKLACNFKILNILDGIGDINDIDIVRKYIKKDIRENWNNIADEMEEYIDRKEEKIERWLEREPSAGVREDLESVGIKNNRALLTMDRELIKYKLGEKKYLEVIEKLKRNRVYLGIEEDMIRDMVWESICAELIDTKKSVSVEVSVLKGNIETKINI